MHRLFALVLLVLSACSAPAASTPVSTPVAQATCDQDDISKRIFATRALYDRTTNDTVKAKADAELVRLREALLACK